jgi:hypothetical protein
MHIGMQRVVGWMRVGGLVVGLALVLLAPTGVCAQVFKTLNDCMARIIRES